MTVISDTHLCEGKLTAHIKKARPDVLVHCGDMTDHGTLVEIRPVAEWLGMLKRKDYAGEVIVIAGNHDTFLQDDGGAVFNGFGLHYLDDSSVTFHGFKFYGSPWTRRFEPSDEGGFIYERGQGAPIWAKIPEDTDILVTHSPPEGIRAEDEGDHGCPHLLARVKEVKPRIHLFGHVHIRHGITHTSDTLFVNASSWTNEHKIMNSPVTLDVE